MYSHDEEVAKKIREADERERYQWHHFRRFRTAVWVILITILMIYLPGTTR
ncbi:hypothetical protein H0P95_004361 [Salmonella enterica]|nr:hypothetical protein [Salmonella enterica]